MLGGEAGGADGDTTAFRVSLVVVVSATYSTILGGDVDIEGLALLTDDGVVNASVRIEEGLGMCR